MEKTNINYHELKTSLMEFCLKAMNSKNAYENPEMINSIANLISAINSKRG
ncbi:hypothetical protein [Bombilactobacillus bombi]|uniref:hypothetical protein n=1 Tax=Bombilactobacillus bombi TaxID=1303590 RepID=UPI0015FC47C6|nr:hypothetical protein [Bombilactobacillus bombi]